jgi:uncharacterized glyoxalase superfamily protein PhnB
MGARIARITVSVSDLSASLDLYQGVLGLKSGFSDETMVMLSDSESVEVLLHVRKPDASDAGVAASFGVDDVDASTAAAVVAGATVIDPPEDQSWGERQSVLRDADGHVFCLISPLPEEEPDLL